jgi:hypothetical protein
MGNEDQLASGKSGKESGNKRGSVQSGGTKSSFDLTMKSSDSSKGLLRSSFNEGT